jgi:hypothetical protein
MIKKTAAVLLVERSPEYAEAVRRWLSPWKRIELRPAVKARKAIAAARKKQQAE